MIVKWLPLRLARQFIAAHHRHCGKLQGAIVALGCWVDGRLVGCVTLGRPARMDSADTVTITRLCTDGYPNACSKLYGKAKRLAQAMGFVRIKTFTLTTEIGASLRASGAEHAGKTAGGTWSRTSRQRKTLDVEAKNRWLFPL